ncbi:MAG: glycosyltransferase [Cyanobacteriota bacterium]|nr:glycosyltransferase [Cyanobacteriota bacterium]
MNLIAAVICTRSCPSMVAEAVRAMLADYPMLLRVIVVQQGNIPAEDPLADLEADPRLLKLHHGGVGLSRARNAGMAAAEAAGAVAVAFTDDDCVPHPGWIAELAAPFGQFRQVGIVYGSTMAADYEPSLGCIPAYVIHEMALYHGIASKAKAEGMGACMAVRVETWRRLRGFDDWLGAGTNLASAEENDFCSRALLAGYTVVETPSARVTHHGFRARGEVAGLIAGYMRGSGAAMAKMLRLGGVRSIPCFATTARRWLGGRSAIDVPMASQRWLRLRAFLAGFRIGLCTPLDRGSGRFRPFRSAEDLLV